MLRRAVACLALLQVAWVAQGSKLRGLATGEAADAKQQEVEVPADFQDLAAPVESGAWVLLCACGCAGGGTQEELPSHCGLVIA